MQYTWITEIDSVSLGIIVFATQLTFILLRTMNVIYTAEKNMIGTMITGAFVHIAWLAGIAIGVKSVMYLDWLVILCSLTGGLIGSAIGIKLKQKIK